MGASGILGSYLTTYLANQDLQVIPIYRSEDFSKLRQTYYKSQNISTIINCVALTNVDFCEKNINKAFNSNANYVKKILSEIWEPNINFIQISTDQVYSGPGPHSEKDTSPLNVYGLTKLIGEEYAKELNPTILRINYLAKSSNKSKLSFTDWLFNSLIKEEKITLFDDILFSPLHISDVSQSIIEVIKNPKKGIYNLGATNSMSKAKFAIKFAEKLSLSIKFVTFGSSQESNLKAERPKDMSMNIEKFEKIFKQKLPAINDSINKICADYM